LLGDNPALTLSLTGCYVCWFLKALFRLRLSGTRFFKNQDMDETLRQVGELLLGSIPTIIFMVLLYWIYNVILHKPLVKVLAERRDKTEGAVEKARADIAAAEARTSEYEQRLREARAAVFKHQEALRQQALQARTAALAEARTRAQVQVEQARAAIEQDKAAAQAGLQAESGKLAAEIIRIVLQPGRPQVPAGGGQ
jgi:F-type H+-transporting ATPase subunit b